MAGLSSSCSSYKISTKYYLIKQSLYFTLLIFDFRTMIVQMIYISQLVCICRILDPDLKAFNSEQEFNELIQGLEDVRHMIANRMVSCFF
jgi:hypothetical protein